MNLLHNVLYFFFIFMSIINDINTFELYPIITLHSTNLLLLKGEINKEITNNFLYNLQVLHNKKDAFIFLDTNGGSVEDGNKIISEILKYNMSCIAEKAYSMGFAILQACKYRYILPFGKIMQHQISFSIQNEKAKIESYLDFIHQIEEKLVLIQSQRIGISSVDFKKKIYNDWWLFAENALSENCADEIVNIECSSELILKRYTEIIKNYEYVYSKCPLIPEYIEKNSKTTEEYIFVI